MNIKTYTNSNQILPTNLNAELLRLCAKLDDANDELEKLSKEWAVNEHAYCQIKALNFLKFQNDPNGAKRTIPATEAIVDKESSKQQLDAYLSRAMKEATLERVRSLRVQISAMQSVAAAMRAEIELAGKGGY